MAITTDLKKTLDTTPVYALVGATDLAVERLRTVPGRLAGLRAGSQAVAGDVRHRVASLPAQVVELPVQATVRAVGLSAQATDAYGALVVRGRGLSRRIGRQKATEELVEEARTTVRRTRAAGTTAKASARTTRRSAADTAATAQRSAKRTTRKGKAAAESAGTTAAAAAKAVEDGAAKVG